MLRAALARVARASTSDATMGLARAGAGGGAARLGAQRSTASGPADPAATSPPGSAPGAPGPATSAPSSSTATTSPPPPSDDDITTLLRRLGVSKTLTRRSLADRAGLLDLVAASVRSARAHLATSLTKKAIETDFDGGAFLEGAVGAYKAVHAAAAAQDWAALAGMTTPAITEAARRLTAAAAAEGLAVSIEVEDSITAEIDTMFLMSSHLVERTAAGWTEGNDDEGGGGGESEDGEAGETGRGEGSSTPDAASSTTSARPTPWTPDLVGKHQGLYVRFSGGAVTLRLAARRGSAAAAAATGLADQPPPPDPASTVLEVADRRARTWIFERGPLPSGLPVRDTQLAWRVLAIEP